jgi:hypothetical protein
MLHEAHVSNTHYYMCSRYTTYRNIRRFGHLSGFCSYYIGLEELYYFDLAKSYELSGGDRYLCLIFSDAQVQ